MRAKEDWPVRGHRRRVTEGLLNGSMQDLSHCSGGRDVESLFCMVPCLELSCCLTSSSQPVDMHVLCVHIPELLISGTAAVSRTFRVTATGVTPTHRLHYPAPEVMALLALPFISLLGLFFFHRSSLSMLTFQLSPKAVFSYLTWGDHISERLGILLLGNYCMRISPGVCSLSHEDCEHLWSLPMPFCHTACLIFKGHGPGPHLFCIQPSQMIEKRSSGHRASFALILGSQ